MSHHPKDIKLDKTFFQRNGGKITDRHFARIIEKAREIEDKVKDMPKLHGLWKDVLLCLELIRDYRSGEYKQISTWSIAAVAFGLLYLINPMELIPDVIPVVGYLDDVAVMVLILKLVKVELEEYEAWRKERTEYQKAISRLLNRE
ncbi:MAG: hypothetical protein Kow0060_12210 [Methylohalobius crimeensis]|nr:DUF1232 domain-containing protein [Methylothermaceae bacterium]